MSDASIVNLKSNTKYRVEDGIKRQRLLTVPLTSNYTSGGTSLTVGTTNVPLLQKNMVFQIDSEILWATADPDAADPAG